MLRGRGCCFERLNSTMPGFWGVGVNVWRMGWSEVMEIVHIKGAVLLKPKSSLIPSKVNTA